MTFLLVATRNGIRYRQIINGDSAGDAMRRWLAGFYDATISIRVDSVERV